jgi:hypothetical protein
VGTLYNLNAVDPSRLKAPGFIATLEPTKRRTGFKVCLFTFSLYRLQLGPFMDKFVTDKWVTDFEWNVPSLVGLYKL